MILGINPGVFGLNYHDPSICLLDENEIIFAIEEERLNGIKHSCGIFPHNAVKECCRIAAERGSEITEIAIGHQPKLWQNRNQSEDFVTSADPRMLLSAKVRQLCNLGKAKVTFYEHHKTHAASAFYCSGFDSALCVVLDGAGELSSASVWLADADGIKKLDEIKMPNSLGYFYAQATAFSGFEPWNEEGKLMALAPYGTSDSTIEKCLHQFFDDDFTYKVSSLVEPCLSNGFLLDVTKSNSLFTDVFGFPPRKKDEEITKKYMDFAYGVQYYTERAVEQYIRKWLNITGEVNLCGAGGLFMNCKMNGYLRDTLPIDKLFVQPVAGDAGTALGAAFLRRAEMFSKSTIALKDLSLGLAFSNDTILKTLEHRKCNYTYSENIARDTAFMLSEGKIVAWFQGRCELGSRALCHRSILSAPKPISVSDEINARIKHRELWRPFACSMLEEYANEILENYQKSQQPNYMIEAFVVKENWRVEMEAVIHRNDFTTRPQVIRPQGRNKLIHEMLVHFYELTGSPMILNTSFNDKGQPIITTPDQAIDFFDSHDIDALSIGNYILRK